MIYYYSPDAEMYVYCGLDPLPEDIVLDKFEYWSHKQVRIKSRDNPLSYIHQTMSEDANDLINRNKDQQPIKEQNNANNGNQNTSNKSRRNNEKKIGFIIEKVVEWRRLYNGIKQPDGDTKKLSLDEAAKEVDMKQVLIAILIINLAFTLDNGVGMTPAMGWGSYGSFGCDVNQENIQQIADKIVSLGLKELGYEYVILESCWQGGRQINDAQLYADQDKFPDGMRALVDYVHEKGLKFGISSNAGTKSCDGYTGSLGYELIDAQTFANWGVDYLEYTNCNNQGIKSEQLYQAMSQALNSTNKGIYYTAVVDNQYFLYIFFQNNFYIYKMNFIIREQVEEWQPQCTNSWNNQPQFQGDWTKLQELIEQSANTYEYAQNGAWNFPGKLYIDGGILSNKQQQLQFAFWALLKSPLILNNNIMKLSLNGKKIITNSEVIAVNQDPLGYQGVKLQQGDNDSYQIWGVPQDGESCVIIVWNTSNERQEIDVNFSQINQQFDKYSYPSSLGKNVQVRELLLQKDLSDQETDFSVTLDAQNMSMLKLTPISNQDQKVEQIRILE
ncbi:Glycoside hydrolase, superfamily [Pseudocohnilembus persalinus]|uniref:Alpha-galactosidase n=1 Tax=Pseudocohnilembus persalinus TaxID=266149 RepID=A0A0V0QJ69_PSEPJ|nr:Glycoside hydrolase, superfamily [Pseudocohnilembus persalinus]|eukprot:KRX02247.1 Glycoside hydrolase, superfamily [Pseudocohnilembus persalinus]